MLARRERGCFGSLKLVGCSLENLHRGGKLPLKDPMIPSKNIHNERLNDTFI